MDPIVDSLARPVNNNGRPDPNEKLTTNAHAILARIEGSLP